MKALFSKFILCEKNSEDACILYILYILHPILKTMCPPGYHHNGFVATHGLRHVMYGCILLVPINQRALKKLS